jgi:hypothetical protein
MYLQDNTIYKAETLFTLTPHAQGVKRALGSNLVCIVLFQRSRRRNIRLLHQSLERSSNGGVERCVKYLGNVNPK